jgi:threonine/homoserine/homoserine lactone efflux protein
MSIALGSFIIFAASQIGTPGPANMAMMATGARFGFRRALPFVAGVAVGKQFIIWPIGFGLMELAQQAPLLFTALKYLSAAYIMWLAWKVANLRLKPGGAEEKPPGFMAGLAVHPLNPKAWAMITGGFTNFVDPAANALSSTATVAICLFCIQAVLHPVWTFSGDRIAKTVAGTAAEAWLMRGLALLTVLSVLFVLFGGGRA